jgi:peptide/nickel transport system ATP-binding protein
LLAVRTFRQEKAQQGEDIDAILDVRGVSAGYTQDTRVVKAIDLRVARQKTIAVVGESGSGKTSLARVITGLLPPVEGQIIFDGQALAPDLESRDRESLRRLQMIFQMPDVALNPRQKVRKILGRPLAFYFGMKGAESEKRIRDLLEMIELPRRYIERYPSELSGGEKQRVCIARALAAQPDLIICDEVTSALDQLVAEEILKLLDRLQNELGVSYLFITHDLATVKAIADEIVVMLQGRIVEQGPKKQILVPPWHEYTELLLSSVPEMDPDWLDQLLAERQV